MTAVLDTLPAQTAHSSGVPPAYTMQRVQSQQQPPAFSAASPAPKRNASTALPSSSPCEARFTEADLDSVAGLVGLQTIRSAEPFMGSSKLYLFEQLTYLDRYRLAGDLLRP